jgi:copper chaperone
MATVVKVKGMSCMHCVNAVKKALGQVDGIAKVEVDLSKGEVTYENTKPVAQGLVSRAIQDAGFEVVN